MFTSKATTICGLIGSLAGIVASYPGLPEKVHTYSGLIAALSIGAMGFFARDHKVSDEKAGAQ